MEISTFNQKMINENNGSVNLIYCYYDYLILRTFHNQQVFVEKYQTPVQLTHVGIAKLLFDSKQYLKYREFNTFSVTLDRKKNLLTYYYSPILDLQKIKKKLSIDNRIIARIFQYQNVSAYANSSAKRKREVSLVAIFNTVLEKKYFCSHSTTP